MAPWLFHAPLARCSAMNSVMIMDFLPAAAIDAGTLLEGMCRAVRASGITPKLELQRIK